MRSIPEYEKRCKVGDLHAFAAVVPPSSAQDGRTGVVTGLATDKREVLVTRPLDAEPSHREELPGPSLWPLVISVTMSAGLIGSIFSLWWLVIGSLISIPPAVAWYWTEEDQG